MSAKERKGKPSRRPPGFLGSPSPATGSPRSAESLRLRLFRGAPQLLPCAVQGRSPRVTEAADGVRSPRAFPKNRAQDADEPVRSEGSPVEGGSPGTQRGREWEGLGAPGPVPSPGLWRCHLAHPGLQTT